MIVDIPLKDDFAEQGVIFLNLACDKVFDLLLAFSNLDEWLAFVGNMDSENYRKAAQRSLSTAIAFSQQGAEFLLKAHIAGISPYILISEKPREWPTNCDKQNTEYSAFRTVDAQYLIRIYDTVTEDRLSEEFKRLYNDLRKKRNTIIHTVNRRIQYVNKEVILAILEISETLIGRQQWTKIRRDYLESTPKSSEWSPDETGLRLSREMLTAIDLLGNAELKRFLKFHKKQRRYICPICAEECSHVEQEFQPATAQLLPNESSSENLYCFVCRKNITVKRIKCGIHSCKGNVIYMGGGNKCLTCYETQKIE